MNNKYYDWDKEFRELTKELTKIPTIETHWQPKEGKPVKYTEMSDKHLINTLRLVCLKTAYEENINITEMYKIISEQIIKELHNRSIL